MPTRALLLNCNNRSLAKGGELLVLAQTAFVLVGSSLGNFSQCHVSFRDWRLLRELLS